MGDKKIIKTFHRDGQDCQSIELNIDKLEEIEKEIIGLLKIKGKTDEEAEYIINTLKKEGKTIYQIHSAIKEEL